MARSFYRPTPENTVEDYRKNNRYYHAPSDTYFTMIERSGKYYQRRYQIGPEGAEINVEEKQIDYVMGSGNHVRTYLHRTANDELQELPLAWYSEKGGYWAMNPGYDKPDHLYSLRKVNYECMACHNSYPQIPSGRDELRNVFEGPLPEGIDCQRCHGPGRRHVEAVEARGTTLQKIRDSIVNPARLSSDRQMEVCTQCHLETTSTPFPHSILKYDRGPFSYQPGQPLSDFRLYFDHPDGPKEDRFEIVSSAYRLRMSQCFIKSAGALQCTTCHDPHNITHGDSATQHYNSVCQQCHTTEFKALVTSGRHTASTDCIECHMPKRRTDDVVHAVMTDHYIQRKKPDRDLLAEKPESNDLSGIYHGEVVPYYPVPFAKTAENTLYLALAQVTSDTNLNPGIVQLTSALQKTPNAAAGFYSELADASARSGDSNKAIPLYEEALKRDPSSVLALRGLGASLELSEKYAKAADTFQRATGLYPEDALLWQGLAEVYMKQEREPETLAALQKSLMLDPEAPEAHLLLGNFLALLGGQASEAGASYLEAIRLQPNYVRAHVNLAILLARQNRVAEASYHFEYALRLQPDYALGHYNYGLMLFNNGQPEEAARQMQEAIRLNPNYAEAHELLGKLAERDGRLDDALTEYSEAVRTRPQYSQAQLELGALLIRRGNAAQARLHLAQASKSSDPAIRERALRLLSDLGK